MIYSMVTKVNMYVQTIAHLHGGTMSTKVCTTPLKYSINNKLFRTSVLPTNNKYILLWYIN